MDGGSECPHCRDGTLHPQFVSLLCDKRLTLHELLHQPRASTSTYWDFSRQPLWNLRSHNRERRFRIGPKATKHTAPHHQNELIIGPFFGNACLFVRTIKERSRKFRSRIARGVRLAQVWHLVDPTQRGEPLRVWGSDQPGHREMIEDICDKAATETMEHKSMLALLRVASNLLTLPAAAPVPPSPSPSPSPSPPAPAQAQPAAVDSAMST